MNERSRHGDFEDIPAGYRCPLCPSHIDEDFVWDEVAEAYLCLGCRYEIDCGLDFDRQPTLAEYNCADTVKRFLALLGMSYEEIKRRYLELSKTQKESDISCRTIHVK